MSIKHILPGNIGLGGAPLGNMFRNIPEDEAHATVAAAWDLGVRYFDTAPLYGSGLSEIRMGEALSQYPRDQFVLSSKVGRIMLDEMEDPATRDFGEKGGLFEYGLKNKILNDYSADATLRSIEDSLKPTILTSYGSTIRRKISTATAGWSSSTSPVPALSAR